MGLARLPPTDHFNGAKALVAELPATFPVASNLEIANSVPSDPGGGMPKREVGSVLRLPSPVRMKGCKDSLAAGPGAMLCQYLTASFDGTFGGSIPQPPHTSCVMTPLVAFRRANCRRIDPEARTPSLTRPVFS